MQALISLLRDYLLLALEPICTSCEFKFMTNIMRDRHSAYLNESDGVATLAAPFEIHVHSTCNGPDPADCLSCPLKSKFQFIVPELPYAKKREQDNHEVNDDECFDCEGCLIFLDEGVGNDHDRGGVKFAPSDLLDKMKGFHEEQMLKAKQESGALKMLLQTQKSAHEEEVGRLTTELAALKFENNNLTFNLEETQRRLRFLKTMDVNLKNKFSKSETASTTDTGIGIGIGKSMGTGIVHGACTMAMERARRYLAAGILKNPPLWMGRRDSKSQVEDQNTSPLLRAVINYCYTDDICFTEKVTPEKVLKVAHLYGLQQLKELCEQALCTKISPDNLWEMFNLSRSFKAKRLRKEVLKYLQANAEECRIALDGLVVDEQDR